MLEVIIDYGSAVRHLRKNYGNEIESKKVQFLFWGAPNKINRDGSLSSAEASLYCGEAGEKEKEGARETPFPVSHRPPRAFYFFDYCYFNRGTQQEPLPSREGAANLQSPVIASNFLP